MDEEAVAQGLDLPQAVRLVERKEIGMVGEPGGQRNRRADHHAARPYFFHRRVRSRPIFEPT
jgi:hypothetical protein